MASRFVASLVIVGWSTCTTVATAGLKLQFAAEDGVLSDSFVIAAPGDQLPIRVYLTQTDVTNDLNTEGLYSSGVSVTFNNPQGVAKVVTVAGNPAFDDTIGLYTAITPTTASLNQLTLGFVPPDGDPPDPPEPPDFVFPDQDSPDRIWLGTFTFQGQQAGLTTITVDQLRLDPGQYDFVTGAETVLDGRITLGTATITVNPEPSSLALSLLIAGGGAAVAAVRRRRQRRLSADGDQAEATAS